MNWEFEILDWIQTLRCPVLDWFMPKITVLGDAGIIWIIMCIILLILPRTRTAGAIMFFSLIADVILCNCIIKPIVARTRPYDINTAIELLISRQKDYSFPSGHTAASFASVMALWFAKEKKLFVGSLILACIIAFSRMYLYVHYPTDIIGGMLLGILCGIIGYAVYMAVRKISTRAVGRSK